MFRIFIILMMVSCGKSSSSKLNELIDYYNAPSRLSDSHISNLDKLPLSGSAGISVWRGSWMPYSAGGTTVITAQYDRAVTPGAFPAWTWEQSQVTQLSGVSWAGHCNGLAAASIMAPEPRHPVTYGGITFSVEDIKVLLIELWQNADNIVIGTRCSSPNPETSNGRMTDSSCRDLNPGAFHIAVTNWLGVFRYPIIADYEASDAVWNYPITSYRVIRRESLSALDAMYWLDGVNTNVYSYNSLAKAWEYVVLEVTLTSGVITYEYILELDEIRNIIGGEWFRNSRRSHPDFLWRATAPRPENPYLDSSLIQEIARQSIL